jgi:hypothetical protein
MINEELLQDFSHLKIAGQKIELVGAAKVVLKRTYGNGWQTDATGVLADGEWFVSNRHGLLINLGNVSIAETIDYMWEWRGFAGIEPTYDMVEEPRPHHVFCERDKCAEEKQ